MKTMIYVALVGLIFFGGAQASSDFNPTPFPLERSQKNECGTWVSFHGPYRLIVVPATGSCESGPLSLNVMMTKQRRFLAKGILSVQGNQFCGSLMTYEYQKFDLCIWVTGEMLHSNVRKNSPWQPFEIFSKETYR